MRVHKGRNNCPIQNICHCVVVEHTNFFQCCGHYHAGNDGCGGRVNDDRLIKLAKVHWDNHL